MPAHFFLLFGRTSQLDVKYFQFPTTLAPVLVHGALDSGATFMSAPSRRPEIRRRRVRKEKITKLRKRIASATSESDRSRLQARLAKLARTSPGQPLVKA
jgi:hypothetical protein